MTAYLVLENGMVFQGEYFGAQGEVTGEVVFTTGMTGYLEVLSDPSYYGQIVVQTFPLIGNYGVIASDFESESVHLKGYIVREMCQEPSNFRSSGSLGTFLRGRGIIGVCGLDTRALTRVIRKAGVMNGVITCTPPVDGICRAAADYKVSGAVCAVSGRSIRRVGTGSRRVALLDFGAKRGICDALTVRGCEVWVYPYNTDADVIMSSEPCGVMLTNGPGDPSDPANIPIIETIRKLQSLDIPIFGICLGHQLLALANGYVTEKLKFGHRGANQPVMDTRTGRIYITSQNHGYTVIAKNPSFVNVNDGSCEGLDYGTAFSVQFHPEARGGPLDTAFLFETFIDRMDAFN